MSDALMKKTKQQLVDIIFRKDDVHKKLKEDNEDLYSKIALINNTNKDLNDKIKDLNKLISNKDTDIANLNTQLNEFIEACDDYASKCQDLINKLNRFKNLAIISVCINISLLITMFILL